jgi:hypothetical protein
MLFNVNSIKKSEELKSLKISLCREGKTSVEVTKTQRRVCVMWRNTPK